MEVVSDEMKQRMQRGTDSGCCLDSLQVVVYEQQERTTERKLP